ncbi:MAG: phosphoenolpyruvate synthase [Bacteroidales bacterium]|nr:phosphoenolpyruvate synthase [Bacteroidales bacterium]
MNTLEPKLLKELINADYDSLMGFRVRRILMICSNYDAFILEEDGQIETRIYKEYIDLNLSTPPKFLWVQTSAEAREMLQTTVGIDMIICMYNAGDNDVFTLASELKKEGRSLPFVLLTHFSKEVYRRLAALDTSAVDYMFSWHGNADLIVAIIKLFEDLKNAENDILRVGVQSILLVEDSVRYYSTYLPELYRMVLRQSAEFLKETLNEQQRKHMKRSRPKILLATNLDDAMYMYEKYKSNLLGVISDVGFCAHRGESPEMEKLDAGLDLVRHIKADDPMMPVLLQSSQESIAEVAEEMGVGFLRKYSKTLMIQLYDYIKEEFAFGEFVFRDANRIEYGRAANLKELELLMRDIPDEILLANTSKNMLSKWFMARGLFTLGVKFKKVLESQFSSTAELRAYVSQQIHDYHALMGRGVIAHFDAESYGRHIWFSRMGDGSLGGKARGLAFLNSLVYKHHLADRYENVKISIPRTVVIATDYFDQFIIENDLQYVIDSDISDDEILSEFVSSRLPEPLVEELRAFLETTRSPLAVRSSSKLEDSSYQPFAGVYSTYMIPLAENRDQMLRMLGKAIKSVYASVFYSGSRAYIQTTGNLLSEEKMAVVVQSICGSEHEGLYYPMLSGVARSVNFYPIGNEKPEDGIVDLAFGLGKTVVDGGNSLRFSPKFPKKILQLSEPKLALRDTQKMMYALDLRPGSFKISKNEGVNLAHVQIADVLPQYTYPEMVASTFSLENNRMVPGITARGPRIISFDALLKYGRYPLAQIIKDLLEICRNELMCDIEMEFAADLEQKDGGTRMNMKLLQVRPVGEYSSDSSFSIDKVCEEMSHVLVRSSKALGSGRSEGITHIIHVPSDIFDSARTKEMAQEIAEFNNMVKNEGGSYLLIGPGRWGSSDPWLGIPVMWSEISEARMIVESAIPGYQIEPSQGTHFFQNITSLGVGYLTIDTVRKDGFIDEDAIAGLECVSKGTYTRLYKAPEGMEGYIDRSSNEAVIGYGFKSN